MTVQIAHLEARVTSDGYVLLANRIGDAERSAQVFERQFAKVEEIQRRAAKTAERYAESVANAAKRESDSWNDQIQKAKARYEREAESAEKAAQRKMAAAEKAAARENESRLASQAKALEGVKRELMTEEQLIRESENRRRRIIISNTEITAAQRAELLRLSAAKTDSQLYASKSGSSGIGIAGAVVGGLAVGGALMAAHSMMEVTREFDKLNASLITVTGSEKEAARAFEALQSFAMTTPFTLREVVGAFVQLRNLGLNATGRELLAFGNMASAFGDTLDHMLLAVGDAAMGINRPLKQFGVMAEVSKNTSKKLSEDGKTVTYTFRGMSTEVEASAIAIQNYLVKLSENNFANAMANRMNTLDGALSNLKDGWDKFVLAITQSGLEAALSKTVNQFSEFLNKLSEKIKNFKDEGSRQATEDVSKNGNASKYNARPNLIGRMFNRFFPDQNTISTEDIEAQQSKEKGLLARLDKYTADANKLRDEKYREEYRNLVKNLRTRRELIEEELKKEKEVIASGVSGNPELDAKMLAKAQKKYDDEIKKLDKKEGAEGRRERREFDRMAERVEKEADPLAQASYAYDEREKMILRFTRRDSERRQQLLRDNDEVYQKDVEKFIAAQTKEIDEVVRSMKTEEDTITESYEKRRAIVEKNVTRPEDRAHMLAGLKDTYEQQLNAFRESQIKQREALTEELATEEDKIRLSYAHRRREVAASRFGSASPFEGGDDKDRVRRMLDRREAEAVQENRANRSMARAEALANPDSQFEALQREMDRELQAKEEARHKDLISTTELEAQKQAVRERFARKESDLQMQIVQESATNAASMFSNFAEAAKNWGGENSSAYRAMFAAQKAFAVASATVSMARGMSSAMDKGWPEGIPFAISAAAEGARILAMISNTKYSGAYDKGGNIPAGQMGIVGEYGLEFVRGPAVVTSRADTARMLSSGAGGGQQPINITVVNSRDGRANSYRASSAREKVLVADARKNKSAMQRVVGG